MSHPSPLHTNPPDTPPDTKLHAHANQASVIAQLNKEAKWAVVMSVVYMLLWAIFAYQSPDGFGLLGLPWWFELSCIYLPLLFAVVGFVVVLRVYRSVDFDNTHLELDDRAFDKHPQDPTPTTTKDKS